MAEEEITPPSVDEVGHYLRARTTDRDGNEIGTFDATTRPTEEQVETYIHDAIAEITTRVGGTFFREEYAHTASNLAAIRAAMSVELSFYPEQISEGQSSYNSLAELYDKGVVALARAIRDGSPERKGFFSIPIVPANRPEDEPQ
jgi:hypothetical protein